MKVLNSKTDVSWLFYINNIFYVTLTADDGSTDMYCDNGGTLVDNAYCVCPDGFIGTHCETRKFRSIHL